MQGVYKLRFFERNPRRLPLDFFFFFFHG